MITFNSLNAKRNGKVFPIIIKVLIINVSVLGLGLLLCLQCS